MHVSQQRLTFSASSCAMILRRLASSPQLAMTTRCAVRPLLLPAASMRFTTAMPSTTLPNTTATSAEVWSGTCHTCYAVAQ